MGEEAYHDFNLFSRRWTTSFEPLASSAQSMKFLELRRNNPGSAVKTTSKWSRGQPRPFYLMELKSVNLKDTNETPELGIHLLGLKAKEVKVVTIRITNNTFLD